MNTEPVHLLIVEDEAAHVEAIRRAFEAAGSRAEIRAVGTLREYREELAASPPDLALVDLNLADGRAVEILTHPPESAPFPILVMTAFGTEQIVVEVMKAGALDYVVKSPETFAGMPQTAARVLREWRLLQKHRQAEAALAASEKRHRAIIDGSPVPLAVNDGQQRITYLNRAFVATFGFTLEDIPTLADWWPKAYPDPQYRKSMEDTWNVRLEQAKQTGNPFVPLEAEVRCKDGTIRSILAGMAPLDDGDNEGEHLVVLYDITERQRAEEQLREQEESYRTLADSGRALIWTAGTDKKCNYFNQPWLKFTGRTREQELGDGWAEGVHPDDLARCFKIYAEAFDRRESFSMDYRLRHHTGEFRWIQDDGTPRHDRRGNFIGYIGHCIDITERKQAEDSLRESEARMRDIVFSMADWVWETDENGRYTYSSQKGKDWFGRVLGKTPFDFMPPDEAKRIIPIFTELAAGKSPIIDLENWAIRKDGTLACLITNGVPILDPAGKLRGYRGVDKDITAAKQADEAVRTSEERLRNLFEQAGDGIFIIDDKNKYLSVNKRGLEMFGYSLDEFLKMGVGDVITPQERPRLNIEPQQMMTGKPHLAEWVHVRKNGEQFPAEVSARRLSDNTYMAIVRDVTERKQIEESQRRLATAVEQSGEAIVITDTEGKILYANPAFEKSSGYTRAEAMGQNPRILKSGKQDGAFYRELWKTIHGGQVWTGHFINQRKDGTLFEEEATISPIRDAAGKIINYVAVKRDVTHEVALEGQLRQSQKMEAIGTLAGGIAHDFNNILNVLFGYCNLLQMDLAGKKEELDKLGEVLKAGERAKDLVQQILTFSRRQEQERLVIHLNTVIKETIKLLRASLPANLEIEMELAAEAPMVLADATQIYQVIMNLGANALHAMEKQATGRLTIALDAFEPDAALLKRHPELRAIQYARLTISDTGCGMDAKTLARIYDPFFTTKPVGKGTGLGLAVVHGIVEAHEGVIAVESKPGQGTTFRIYLPAQIPDMFLAGIPENLIPCGQGQRILMVDDEVALVGMYQKLLKALKYEGTIVTDPEEAVGLVRKHPEQYDLVITDLTMPGMSGLEVARRIREIRKDMPVILATGFHGTVTDQQLQAAGICEVVEKPISMAALAMVLRGMLG